MYHDFGIFKVVKRDRWTIIQLGDWANCLAFTTCGLVIMVEQYRAGSDMVSLELPGGKVDLGELSHEAACRELLEETGYAGTSQLLGHVRPNPAIMNNTMSYYVVKNAIRVADQNLDEGEDVELIFLEYATLKKKIKSGEINHALTLAAVLLYELSLEK